MEETTTKGYRTTEFWLSVVVAIVSFVMASGAFGAEGKIFQGMEFVVAALTAMGYSISRGLAKLNPPA